MKVQSVAKYRPATYPDKEAVMGDPDLLRNLPERWKRNAAACAALVVTSTMIMTSCGGQKKALVFDHGKGKCLSDLLAIELGERTAGMVAMPELPIVLDESAAGDLMLDGYDKEKDIVSVKDASEWKVWVGQPSQGNSVTFDMRTGAHRLAENLQNNSSSPVIAVFYDPMRADLETLKQYKGKDMSQLGEQEKNDLRAQVRDFINWLKAQHII